MATVTRAHKIRLNPTTPEQEQWLFQACGVARFCFNWGLAEVGSQTPKTDVDGIVRPFGAVLCEAFKVAEERQPSRPCQFGTVW